MATRQEAAEAERPWLEAKKIIHGMQKKLRQMSKEDSSSKKLADLESVEHMLETLRLACMATTFSDIKFAHENHVLDKLWQVHTLISAEYKKALPRHRGHQIVQFRTIEKQYAKHLKTAQYFYKGFVARLSARYQLVPLQRIARLMKSETIKLDEVIDAREAHLGCEVMLACYRTLLHLGDLARYRLNTSRQKGQSPDMALTYYSLAQDLMPHEGDAHHQMAVVMADQHKDFAVVYHFVRAWAVRHPNDLAPKNLASEFKRLLQPLPARKANNATPPDPCDLFASWLIRLHAYYFVGEDFSQQDELEREVLHRWEVLLKSADKPDYLQKAVLTSIAAYDIALRRVEDEWSTAKSKSCQFILHFLVRTILVLSRVLEDETQRLSGGLAADGSVEADGDKVDKTPRKKNAASDTCLSLFRTCMAWILLRHQDLIKFQKHLSPHIAEMHHAVTRCLSLFVDITSSIEAAPAPYLLPEDTELLGLAPLDGWTALHLDGASSPDTFKLRIDEAGIQRLDPAHETLARIYDIVECASTLMQHTALPWHATTVVEANREVTRIYYAENYVTPSVASPTVPPAPNVSVLAPCPFSTTVQSPAPPMTPTAAPMAPPMAPPVAASTTALQTASANMSWPSWMGSYIPESNVQPDTDLDLDSDVFDRVETFLNPPESSKPRLTTEGVPSALSSLSPIPPSLSPSYGMHTATADDIFGQLQRSPAASSVAARTPVSNSTFPGLPWEHVFKPMPYQTVQPTQPSQQSPQMAAAGTNPWSRAAPAPVDERLAYLSLAPGSKPPINGTSRGFPTALSPIGLTATGNPWGSSDGRLLPQQIQQAQAESLGFTGSQPSFYGSSLTINSSMPSVQSPRGLPASPQMGARPDLQNMSTAGFARQSGAATDGQQSVEMRRKWEGVATAWSRGTPPRDDPPPFRNAGRQKGIPSATNTYDRNALLSALGNTAGSKPR